VIEPSAFDSHYHAHHVFPYPVLARSFPAAPSLAGYAGTGDGVTGDGDAGTGDGDAGTGDGVTTVALVEDLLL